MGGNNNPKGNGGFKVRPDLINKKGNTSRSEEFRQLFKSGKNGMSEEELVQCLRTLCRKNDRASIQYAMDKLFGKTKETIEHEVPEEINITIVGDRGD